VVIWLANRRYGLGTEFAGSSTVAACGRPQGGKVYPMEDEGEEQDSYSKLRAHGANSGNSATARSEAIGRKTRSSYDLAFGGGKCSGPREVEKRELLNAGMCTTIGR
jgi:hypothetical protein